MATKKEPSDAELLKAALRDIDTANKVGAGVVQAVRWEGKKEQLDACDAFEKHLGRPVKKPLNGEA